MNVFLDGNEQYFALFHIKWLKEEKENDVEYLVSFHIPESIYRIAYIVILKRICFLDYNGIHYKYGSLFSPFQVYI